MPGHELAGVVTKVGAKVKDIKVSKTKYIGSYIALTTAMTLTMSISFRLETMWELVCCLIGAIVIATIAIVMINIAIIAIVMIMILPSSLL